jgi:hypothetical protein
MSFATIISLFNCVAFYVEEKKRKRLVWSSGFFLVLSLLYNVQNQMYAKNIWIFLEVQQFVSVFNL